MSHVLDASVVLAAVLGEMGQEEARAAMESGAISAVNLAEVASILSKQGAGIEIVRETIAVLHLTVVPLDEALAFDTGALAPVARDAGLSLGDRACLALARSRGLPALTADRAWKRIEQATGVEIVLIR